MPNINNTTPNIQTALEIFKKFNFEVHRGGGQHWTLKKSYHNEHNIIVTINGYSWALYVHISGYSIKQERTVKYDFKDDANDIKRLEDRLKRLLKRASNYDEDCKKAQNENDISYETIRDYLLKLGAISKDEKRTIRQYYGNSNAKMKVNGYEIVVNKDMETRVRIGEEDKYVNIEPAIQIINLMPTHVPYTEDF